MEDVRAMQLAERKSDAYRHVFETVVGDGLDEGLVENKAELISRSR